MSHRLTMVCDNCGQEYLLATEMELPPYWTAVQLAVANKNGEIPLDVPDIFIHLCSHECLKEFVAGSIIRSRIALIDKLSEEEVGDESDDIQ